MAPRPDIELPVEATGSLRVDAPDGGRIDVTADGSHLHADVPDWKKLKQLGPGSLLARRRAVVRAAKVLETLGLYLVVDVAQRHAVSMGANTKPSLVSRVLRLGRVNIPFSSVISLLRNA